MQQLEEEREKEMEEQEEERERARCRHRLAFAKASLAEMQLFMAFERMAERRVREFKAQELASAAWALSESVACDVES